MGRRHLLYLLYTSSVRPPSSTPYFVAPPPPPFLIRKKGYSQESSRRKDADADAEETMDHQRAPSTLEEFKRVEEAMASQGIVSQTADKARDGAIEEASGTDFEGVKESFKGPVSRGMTKGE